ncbi:cytochrome P450 [Lentinus tigrinus ALCF2SS1-7]|uniref:Cytochrome P450 n=1 Tax=Lentinus tigrinus ALCF2SS1-6 TaxID=1328759 RepID=A0A5C2SNL7_9APHY|nr:cytochrome P450 [Lentinus tigrinus ALCF2SS1-6]RPD82800.1 cytochrome P450 [Lentinus tigrinus ALCF2SS1-7]
MGDSQTVIYALLAILAGVYLFKWKSDPLSHIPTVGGPSAPVVSYLSAINFLRNPKALLREGYQRFHGSVFKVALLGQWMVIVSGPKMVDELRKRPDEELSFIEGVEETLHTRFMLGREPLDDPFHVDIIKEKLMRSLTAVLPDVIDELRAAVPDYIHAKDDEWITVNAIQSTLKIVSRASNRVFVGLPVCRNQEYLDLAIRFTIDVIKDKVFISFIPESLKVSLGQYFSAVKSTVRQTIPHLKPLLDERRAKLEEFGDDYPEKPNDMLQWILEGSIPRNYSDVQIIERIMLVNFAAIHTSSNSIAHALLDLAAYPEYIQPLREEIEGIISAEGWSKAAMGKMWKVDSFLRESQRINGIGLTSVTRKTLTDITLNDGTFIPKDTLIVAASYPTHYDDAIYENAETFDPFRFSRMREGDGEGTKHQFVNTSIEYIPFGHGKHACPGRFFAANELKAMLAFIVLNYDLKLANDAPRPENRCFGAAIIPDPTAEIMFRKRQTNA